METYESTVSIIQLYNNHDKLREMKKLQPSSKFFLRTKMSHSSGRTPCL